MGYSVAVEEGTRFYGRTFAEYRRMFDLDLPGLGDASVLDCPGGPSSFTAVASDAGATATAADPEYGPPVETLAEACESAIDDVATQLAETADSFVWDEYGDVDTRIRYARAAAARFLADYARHPDRYVDAALPSLPFDRDAFDLVLSSNLLFLYDDRLDEAFHVESARELCRVAEYEVRLSGLQTLAATESDRVGPVVDALEADGLAVDRRPVPYQFQPGATEQLVVTGVGDYAP